MIYEGADEKTKASDEDQGACGHVDVTRMAWHAGPSIEMKGASDNNMDFT